MSIRKGMSMKGSGSGARKKAQGRSRKSTERRTLVNGKAGCVMGWARAGTRMECPIIRGNGVKDEGVERGRL